MNILFYFHNSKERKSFYQQLLPFVCRSYNLRMYPRWQLIFNLHTRVQSPVHCLIRFLNAVWRLFSIYMCRAQKDPFAVKAGMKDFRPLAAFYTWQVSGRWLETPLKCALGTLVFFRSCSNFFTTLLNFH